MKTYKCRVVPFLTLLSLLVVLFATTACEPNVYTREQARTHLGLADVTGAAGLQGKYYNSKPTASVWYDNAHPGKIIICYHDRDASGMTAQPTNCGYFGYPTQLPKNAEFLAINEGTGQKTQSAWGVFGQLSNVMQLYICNHDNDWLSGQIATATDCSQFERPSQVANDSVLVSLNSGSGIAAESFWQNDDGSVTVCQHDKNATGFLGFGGLAFGAVNDKGCQNMPIPYNLFPNDLENPRLTAVNSDSNEPWETFWQDANGYVIHCKHDRVSGAFLSGDLETMGAATWCGYWIAPQPSDFSS